MNCTKCGHQDALALFSSILCVSDTCRNYDKAYAEERGYTQPVGIIGATSIAAQPYEGGLEGWSGVYGLFGHTLISASWDGWTAIAGWSGLCGYSGMCDYFEEHHH